MVLNERRYPGVMVDVGGYNLFFNCTAPAPYTVLLEAGGGGVSLMWKPVQDLLATEEGVQVDRAFGSSTGIKKTGNNGVECDTAGRRVATQQSAA